MQASDAVGSDAVDGQEGGTVSGEGDTSSAARDDNSTTLATISCQAMRGGDGVGQGVTRMGRGGGYGKAWRTVVRWGELNEVGMEIGWCGVRLV